MEATRKGTFHYVFYRIWIHKFVAQNDVNITWSKNGSHHQRVLQNPEIKKLIKNKNDLFT